MSGVSASIPLAARPSRAQLARDVLSVIKSRITLLNLFATAAGVAIVPGSTPALTWVATLLGSSLVIAGACALNCYLERDLDVLMVRTRERPLAAGRLAPDFAVQLGVLLSGIGLPILTVLVNPLTAFLGAVALVSYVLVYTPMKRKSWLALYVGAVPGAMPPLMGYTAVTGHIGLPGVLLFAILFFWQLPHFLALSLLLQDDYARAGIRVMPREKGVAATRFEIVRETFATVLVSLLPLPFGVAGAGYLVAASLLGVGWIVISLRGLKEPVGEKWAKQMFGYSIVYLTLLFTALMIETAL